MVSLPKPFPKWMRYLAYHYDESPTWPVLRLLLLYFDIRPNLFRAERGLRKIKPIGLPLLGHIHMPKTGGNYVTSLSSLPHVNFSHVLVRTDRSDRWCPVGLTALDESKVRDYFLFSAVRSPLGFMVSYYHHVIGFGRYVNKINQDYDAACKGFDYFVKYIINREHSWPSRRFLFPQLFGQDGECVIDWVNRNENLDSDLRSLHEHFGLAYKAGDRKRVAPKKSPVEDYYSDALRSEVMSVYSRESFLFGYDGLVVGSPRINLTPLEKERIKYMYKNDCLLLDGKRLGSFSS